MIENVLIKKNEVVFHNRKLGELMRVFFLQTPKRGFYNSIPLCALLHERAPLVLRLAFHEFGRWHWITYRIGYSRDCLLVGRLCQRHPPTHWYRHWYNWRPFSISLFTLSFTVSWPRIHDTVRIFNNPCEKCHANHSETPTSMRTTSHRGWKEIFLFIVLFSVEINKCLVVIIIFVRIYFAYIYVQRQIIILSI